MSYYFEEGDLVRIVGMHGGAYWTGYAFGDIETSYVDMIGGGTLLLPTRDITVVTTVFGQEELDLHNIDS